MSKIYDHRHGIIAGVDEVGLGPLAGPVVACAVILDPDVHIEGLRDSKATTEKSRHELAILIRQHALSWCIGRASVAEVDELNVLQASHLAMRRAVFGLSIVPDKVLVDGNKIPELPMTAEAIVKGDRIVGQISAASILAKVARDAELVELAVTYPGYGFAQHKGYPTKKHMIALSELGPCAEHRRSFAPVRRALEQGAYS
ncbi:MAG: ribonuclease HII [Candidatus Azotimanducaceae bacterium]|jgi:ribonuclease HII|tara:strand:+ start:124 stop:726 length:603 start_codon:yes stop_codon:yes gene_type:complete